jgi:hypothetical protein
MYRKVCLASNQNEKFLIQASRYELSKHRFTKNIEVVQVKKFDYQIKFLEMIQNNLVLVITENMEFSVISLEFFIVYQGKFLVQKPLPRIIGCVYQGKFPSILLSFRPSSITNLQLKPKPQHYNLAILDEVHWPSSYSEILSIIQIRGESPEDFAVLSK